MSGNSSVEDDGQDFELPPAEVTVRHRQTGGADVLMVVATFALVPFVQAVVSAFGAKLADAIDTSTRGAVRRLLRRVCGVRRPGDVLLGPRGRPLATRLIVAGS